MMGIRAGRTDEGASQETRSALRWMKAARIRMRRGGRQQWLKSGRLSALAPYYIRTALESDFRLVWERVMSALLNPTG